MQERFPDLPDMINLGMGVAEALAFWNEMMNSPIRDADHWWRELKVYHLRSLGMSQSPSSAPLALKQ